MQEAATLDMLGLSQPSGAMTLLLAQSKPGLMSMGNHLSQPRVVVMGARRWLSTILSARSGEPADGCQSELLLQITAVSAEAVTRTSDKRAQGLPRGLVAASLDRPACRRDLSPHLSIARLAGEICRRISRSHGLPAGVVAASLNRPAFRRDLSPQRWAQVEVRGTKGLMAGGSAARRDYSPPGDGGRSRQSRAAEAIVLRPEDDR